MTRMADEQVSPPGGPAPSFSLRYEWAEATVPPPYHYEWTLEIHDQQGRLTFWPDYPQHGATPWIRDFAISQEQLLQLHAALNSSRVFRTRWQKPKQIIVGGEQDTLTIWRDGLVIKVPALRTAGANRNLAQAREAIRACVPPVIWDGLFDLREKKIQSWQR